MARDRAPATALPLPDWGPADLAAALAPRPAVILDGLTVGADRCALVAWDLGPPVSVGRALAVMTGVVDRPGGAPSTWVVAPAALRAAVGYMNWDGTEWFHLPGSAALFDQRAGRLWVRGELPPAVEHRVPAPLPPRPVKARPLWSRADYCAAVRTAREKMASGDLQKVILSVPFAAPCSLSAVDIFGRLADGGGSGLAFLMPHGEDGTLVGRSPEPLVLLTGRRAELRLLAGTRRDGEALEHDLLTSAKDREEHLVAVAQARRDLLAVCLAESVSVDACMEVESHPGLIHLASRLSGFLREGAGPADLIRSCFPAGTVGGVPRESAVSLIDRLEPVDRDWYAGAVGALLPDGGVQLWLTIRSLRLSGGMARLQTGAGLVKGSVPEAEWQECMNKVRATAAAMGAEVADDGSD